MPPQSAAAWQGCEQCQLDWALHTLFAGAVVPVVEERPAPVPALPVPVAEVRPAPVPVLESSPVTVAELGPAPPEADPRPVPTPAPVP